jgi:hypothetical protein
VDGLATICAMADVRPPDFLGGAGRLFEKAVAKLPLATTMSRELTEPKDVGAYVEPARVPDLLDFLTMHGARIIRAAARAGEGPLAEGVLRKVKECAVYAEKRGVGYLEASGIAPPELTGLEEAAHEPAGVTAPKR